MTIMENKFKKEGFKYKFETWLSKMKDLSFMIISPRVLNKVYLEFTASNNVYCLKDSIDYNFVVDKILSTSNKYDVKRETIIPPANKLLNKKRRNTHISTEEQNDFIQGSYSLRQNRYITKKLNHPPHLNQSNFNLDDNIYGMIKDNSESYQKLFGNTNYSFHDQRLGLIGNVFNDIENNLQFDSIRGVNNLFTDNQLVEKKVETQHLHKLVKEKKKKY